MITYSKAKALILPGEKVYTTVGKQIIEHTVKEIQKDSLVTDKDVLFYDEHKYIWWLTRKGALLQEERE